MNNGEVWAMDTNLLGKLPASLLPWYARNRRDLPWRADREPYHIWLSEIMLQQPRVEAVKGYYARFLNALPTVADLANCDDDALHKLWEGLGYYSRVRNLKKAAQVILENTAAPFHSGMRIFWRCPESEPIPPEPSLPSPSPSPERRWTAMCCGCCPG